MDAFRQNWGLRIKTEPLVNTYLNYDKYKIVRPERPRPPAQDEIPQQPAQDEILQQPAQDEIPQQPAQDEIPQPSAPEVLHHPDWGSPEVEPSAPEIQPSAPEIQPSAPQQEEYQTDEDERPQEVENDWEDEYENLINEYGQDIFMDIMNDMGTRVPGHLSKRTNKERPFMPNSAPTSLYSLRTVKRIL